jgi:hypothetical protein
MAEHNRRQQEAAVIFHRAKDTVAMTSRSENTLQKILNGSEHLVIIANVREIHWTVISALGSMPHPFSEYLVVSPHGQSES